MPPPLVTMAQNPANSVKLSRVHLSGREPPSGGFFFWRVCLPDHLLQRAAQRLAELPHGENAGVCPLFRLNAGDRLLRDAGHAGQFGLR